MTTQPADLLSAFAATVEQHGDRAAIRYFDGVLSFSELDARADALAGHLVAHGFAAGDRLALYLQSNPAFVVGLLAAWKAGGAAIVMNPMYRRREVEYLLIDSGATGLLCLDDLYDDVVAGIVADGATALRQVVTVAARDDQTRDDTRVLPEPVARVDIPYLRDIVATGGQTSGLTERPDPDALALLMYTSGTTGRPKGAAIPHRAMAFTSQVYRDWIGVDENDRVLAVAPLFHITGLIGHVGVSLLTGATLILHHRFDGSVVLDAIREHRPTFTVGAVTVFNNLASRPDVAHDDFRSFRAVYSGGAPIAPALRDTIRGRIGISLHNLYGMTETTGPAVGVPLGAEAPVDPTTGALAIGVPVSGTVVRIVDEARLEVPPGEIGEILIRGPQVIPEYWGLPEETAERIVNGEIATGDVGFRDDAGWLYLVDRKSDVINASGYKVWPREVEDVLLSHPAVREAAVVGVPDAYRGETVKAVVVVGPDAPVEVDDLVAFCRTQMAAYKCPRIIEVSDELPKSVTGKILRRELRATRNS